MAKITYENKVALNVNSDIADINKVNASDLNEIKDVVNANDDNTTNNTNAIGNLSELTTPVVSSLVGAINSVVESGSNANGNYIKYADGTMICTKKVIGEVSFTSSWGSLYDTGDNPFDLGNWAIPFIDVPIVSANFTGGNGQWIEGFAVTPSKTSAGKINIVSAVSKPPYCYYDVIGIGKWK